MSPAAQAILLRMARCPSSLYVREITQGVKGYETSEILDALCELEDAGFVTPRTWALTDDGTAAAAEVLATGQAAA